MSKRNELEALYEKYKTVFQGKEIVLGDGNPDARILLIGEAPGRDEVKQLRPFVGMAGRNLSEFLDVLKIKREDIYITNAIKYRLSKVNELTGRIINRPATSAEITESRPYLLKEISIIQPEYVVTLGNVPLKSVAYEKELTIGQSHGQIFTIKIIEEEYKLFPLYHPASIIYKNELKDVYIKDINMLKTLLDAN